MTSATPNARLQPTLSSSDYCSPEVFETEVERIFHAGWMYVCHVDGIPVGSKRVFDLAGESVLVARDLDGTLRAFANVCRRGIGYRADIIDPAEVNERGWDMFWDPRFKGVTSILDDYREGIALALLRSGNTDVNTTDTAAIDKARTDLQQLVDLVNVKVNITGYTDVPEGATHLAHTWSGDMLAGAASYLPEGTDPSVLGWWFPADGKGVVGNDCMAVTANAKNPVLAHLYIDFLLDAMNAEENWYWNGYLPPIKGLDAAYLVGQGLTPANLESAVLTDQVIEAGLRFEPLALEADQAWEAAWSRFTAG